jgi:multiple sugar transport system permease protein
MTRRERQQLVRGMAFISPWLLGFCALTVLPVCLSLYHSFCDYSVLEGAVWIGSENYRQLMGDKVFWTSLKNTFVYAAIAIPAGMLVSLGLALLLNLRIGGQSVYRTVIFLPSLVPVVASAMLWLWIFNAKYGLINGMLAQLGVEHLPGWLTTRGLALPSLAFMSLWGVGHTVVIYLAGLQDVPVELYEAAELDGAGAGGRLWHVTLPMLSPVIFFNLVMAVIGTMQVFAIPFIMTGGGPARSTYFLTMYLYDNAFTYLKMGYASAIAWVQLLIVMGLTGIAFWGSRKWVHYAR